MNNKLLKKMIFEMIQDTLEKDSDSSMNSVMSSITDSQKSDQWIRDIEKAALSGDKNAIHLLIKSFKKANEALRMAERKISSTK